MFVLEEGEGLSNSNQYTSNAEVLAYAMSRHGYDWFYKSSDCVIDRNEVDKAIVSASDRIDSIKWGGCRVKRSQAMEFPRKGLYNKCDCTYSSCDSIPADIKEAVIILTLAILKGDVDFASNESFAKVKKMTFDKQSIEFKDGAYIAGGASCGGGMKTISGDRLSQVRHLIDCYEQSGRSANLKFNRSL